MRQRGHACSGAHCMLGVTRTRGWGAMSRQPRSRRQGEQGAAARGCMLWRSGRRQGKLGAGMRILARARSAPTQTHVAPHSSKAPGLIKSIPLYERSKVPVNPAQEPVRTSGAPAHTPGALSPSLWAGSMQCTRAAPPASVVNVPTLLPSYLQHPASEAGALSVE